MQPNESNVKHMSLWVSRSHLQVFPSLKNNLQVDVCIIGAGIAGLTTAFLLHQQGKTVAVLDDGPICGGETSFTTAHLTNVLDDRYSNLENFFGTEGARLAAESHGAAIDFIEKTSKKYQIPCGFERLNAYLFVPPGESQDILEEELATIKRMGNLEASFVSKAPMKSFDTGRCLKISNQAEFFPLVYLEAICNHILENKGQIYSNSHAKNIHCSETGCEVQTTEGWKILAKDIVVATNSPIVSRFFPHLKQASYRTYVIAGKIPVGNLETALYYDTPDPYHYIRVVKFDERHDYFMVGGEDHRTGQNANPKELFNKIEKWARQRFPELEAIEYQWSGQIIEPVDSLAFIGKYKDHIYMATGDSGNGLTHGTIAGILISDLIMGKSNPWQKLYDPHRITLKAFNEFCDENFNTIAQYTDWITPGTIENFDQLKPDSGGILRDGLTKVAAYRDKEGKLHKFSAICPHLFGLVRWNDCEKSFDCPCHGSRFSKEGKVINGPANQNLKTLEE